MKIQLVVFDMAGTTVYDDDAVNRCVREALGEFGVHVDRDAVNRVMGEPKPVAIATLLADARGEALETVRSLVAPIHARFERRMLDHYRRSPAVRAVDGAEEVFAALKARGIKVALDTGFNRPIVQAVLERLAWNADGTLIDVVVTSDDVGRGRPHPDMIVRAMSVTGVADAAAVAKVGDTPADLLEGTAAGCGRVIGITSGTHARELLQKHPHTDLVDDLREVLVLCGAPAS
jgi:phosphonatase-like hydrolase